MKTIELKIEIEKVEDLVPYARNAKKHPPEQVRQIAASIKEFGNCDPVAVWTNAKGEPEIVEGHGRVLALKELGIDKCPVIYLDHLSDEQRRAYTHVHNQTTLTSGFDLGVLDLDMDELDFDWGDFGFGGFDEGFSAIDDLLTEEFAGGSMKDLDTFNVTFTFPIECRDAVNDYINEVGKDTVVSMVREAAEKWA